MSSSTARYQPTGFERRLEAHMKEWRARVDGSRHKYWKHWTHGIYPAYRDLAETSVRADAVRLHN